MRKTFFSAILLCVMTQLTLAQATRPAVDVPYSEIAPTIDGKPDNTTFDQGVLIDNLVPSMGRSKSITTQLPTAIKILWNERALYFRFTCEDPDVFVPIEGNDRDKMYYTGDAVEVFLDAKGDGRQLIELQVTPANQIFDQSLLVTADEIKYNKNGRLIKEILDKDWWKVFSYDIADLKTAAGKSADGKAWIVDLAIPAEAVLRRLGKKQFEPMTVKANLMRYDWLPVEGKETRTLNPLNWSIVEFGCPHQSAGALGSLVLKK